MFDTLNLCHIAHAVIMCSLIHEFSSTSSKVLVERNFAQREDFNAKEFSLHVNECYIY
jgi:hypothetical protein